MARLAIFVPDMRGGGAERVALTLAEGFIDRGHDVDLILLQATGELLELVPVQARVIDLQVSRMRRSIRPLADYLRQHRPEALLAVMWPLTVVAALSRKLAGTATSVAVSDHCILSRHYADRPLTMSAVRLSTRLLYPRADVRIAPSEGIAADLSHLSGLRRESFSIIHNPIAISTGSIASNQETDALWGDAKARILAVGSLKPEKDFKLLIEAFATLRRDRHARLIIVGEGQLRHELEALANRLGVQDSVSLPGFRDPWPFYASADLVVLSSRSEGFGNVLVEAMSAGLPVVSTNCDGPREILADGKWGTLVPVGDRDSLALAMERELDESVDRERLKSRAREFDADVAIDAYLAALLGSSQSVAEV